MFGCNKLFKKFSSLRSHFSRDHQNVINCKYSVSGDTAARSTRDNSTDDDNSKDTGDEDDLDDGGDKNHSENGNDEGDSEDVDENNEGDDNQEVNDDRSGPVNADDNLHVILLT